MMIGTALRRVSLICAAASLSAAPAVAQQDRPRSVIPWVDEAISDPGAGGAVYETTPIEGLGGSYGQAAPSGAERAPIDRTGAESGTPSADPRTVIPPQLDLSTTGEPRRIGPSQTPPRASAADPASVEIAPIGRVADGAAGLSSAQDLGLPISAWSRTDEARAVALAEQLRPTRLRSVNRLAIRLLSTAFEPPIGDPTGVSAPQEDFLSARIKALTRFGAAERASRLAEIAGAHRLSGAADAALVAGRLEPLCRALLTPDEPASQPRIYCQILAGDQVGAMIALEASRSLGDDDEITLSLLEALAEPALKDLATPPETVAEITPLRLAAMRMLSITPPPDFARTAPLPLLPTVFGAETPPRETLSAYERLERSGALETADLRAAFDAASSAESGGVWGRVEVYDRAAAAAPEALLDRAQEALARAQEGGRASMMARLLGPALAAQAERALSAGGSAGAALWTPKLRDALRLSGRPDLAAALARRAPSGVDAEEQALDIIATGRLAEGWAAHRTFPMTERARRGDRRAGLILAALDAFGAPIEDPSMFADEEALAFFETGQEAELAFEALTLLVESDPIAPEALRRAMARLIAVGLESEAREIAVEAIVTAE